MDSARDSAQVIVGQGFAVALVLYCVVLQRFAVYALS
jgi:hypothetical protein